MPCGEQVGMAGSAVKFGDRDVGEIYLAPITVCMAGGTLVFVMSLWLVIPMTNIAAGVISPGVIDIRCAPAFQGMTEGALGIKMNIWSLRLVADAAVIPKIMTLQALNRVMPGNIRGDRGCWLRKLLKGDFAQTVG